ncbi:MAG: NAD-dependent epimerase/dehydratase family protein [Candidatus Kapaibacterium sp.]
MNKKAVVTGATGFIGSHVADKLLERGYEVICTVRKSSNLRWLKDKPIKTVEASLDDKESLKKAVEGADYIFHVAGLTFARNDDEFMRGNRDATKNLLEAAMEKAPDLKRFLFVSSQTVTGPSTALDKPVDETTVCKPLTAYGRSKKAAEEEVLKMKDLIPITVVRAPAVFGPRDTAIFDVFKSVRKGIGPLIGSKPKYISLIHSDDLVRGIIDAAESDKTIGGIYFVSSGEFYTWERLIDLIGKSFGNTKVLKLRLPHPLVLTAAGLSEFFGRFSTKPPVFNYEKGIDFIQDYWICSIEKSKRDFGFEQKVSIEEGIENTCKWYLDNKWL